MKAWYAQRRLRGLCVLCGQPVTDGSRTCPSCHAKEASRRRINDARRRQRLREEGQCRKCVQPRLGAGLLCESHYFMNRADLALGSTAFAAAIKQKLLDQGSLCYYTGLPLVLAVNDSLDHLLSVSKHPELRADVDNVVWCAREINTMKNGMDRDEFLAMCRLLAARWPG
jgi:hypothetical protein